MPDPPTTVAQYLKSLPKERREALGAVRAVIRDNLDSGYREGFQSGAISYYVPHSVYPPGYHTDPRQPLPFASLVAQKRHLAVYLFGVYTSETERRWFQDAWGKTGKTLDMGRSCLRFKTLDDVALDVVGQAVRRLPARTFIARYEAALGARRRPRAAKTTGRGRRPRAK